MPYFVAERLYLGTLVQPIFDEITPALQPFDPCRTRESPQLSGFALKRFLSIFRDFIFDSSVDRGMPNFAAAPAGPNTRPRLAFRASSIMFFSCASSLLGSSMWHFDSVAGSGEGNQLSSIEKISDSQRITERSIT